MPLSKQPVGAKRVEDIMTHPVHFVTPTMHLREVVMLYLTHKISGAPVVDQSHRVISVISQTDLLRFVAVDGMDKLVIDYLPRLPKAEEVVSVKKNDTVKDVIKQFLIKPVRRVIVVDSGGKLQGIVSKSNLLKVFIG